MIQYLVPRLNVSFVFFFLFFFPFPDAREISPVSCIYVIKELNYFKMNAGQLLGGIRNKSMLSSRFNRANVSPYDISTS